jgi:hypothetical protein
MRRTLVEQGDQRSFAEDLQGHQQGRRHVHKDDFPILDESRSRFSQSRIPFAERFPRAAAMKDWLFTSRMVPTTMQILLAEEMVDGEVSSRGLISEKASKKAFNHSVGGFHASWGYRIKHLALNSIGIDGYDPLTKKLTCADGKVVEPFGVENLTWKMIFVSLFGLPSRPETMVLETYQDGERLDHEARKLVPKMMWREVPKYSFLQFLRNMMGGWNPVEEKLTGTKVKADGQAVDGESQNQQVTLTQNRWTEKKRTTLALALIRVPLFVVFNLVTWPFKLVRNLVRAVTEIALPVFSMGVLKLNIAGADSVKGTAKAIYNGKGWGAAILFLPRLALLLSYTVITLGLLVGQYALSLASRAAKAFTSPLTSALLAYNSGVLIWGPDYSNRVFPRIVGWIGFILSMALSVTVWTFTLPLALGALVNAVPALLTPIATLAQSPFIATALAWFTQLPFVTVLSTAFGTAFGVVGSALTATFGAAVASMGALVGVAIPQVVVAFSLVLTVVVMPALTLVTRGVELLSNAIMRWVEQRPVHTLFANISAGVNAAAHKLVSGLAAAGRKLQGLVKGKVENPLLAKDLREDKETDSLLAKPKTEQLDDGSRHNKADDDFEEQLAARSQHLAGQVKGQNPNNLAHDDVPVQQELRKADRSKQAPESVIVYQNPETKEYIVTDHALKLGFGKKQGEEWGLNLIEGVKLDYATGMTFWNRAKNNPDRSSSQKAVFIEDLNTEEHGEGELPTVIAAIRG